MGVQRLAAFTMNGQGGNPAGVVIADTLPDPKEMQSLAAEVGYSETAFAAPHQKGFRVRYFAPEAEVPFCGHATIALGAALGAAHGAGAYSLTLNDAEISVRAFEEGGVWGAQLTSPGTSNREVEEEVLSEALDLFGLTGSDLDPHVPPARINGGAEHLLLSLAGAQHLREMAYDFDTGARFMRAQAFVTINLIWRERPSRLHSRNIFAGHGIYEDPATGAAAAALAGYLRDTGLQDAPFEVLQGIDMGCPSRLLVTPLADVGAPVQVAGVTASIV